MPTPPRARKRDPISCCPRNSRTRLYPTLAGAGRKKSSGFQAVNRLRLPSSSFFFSNNFDLADQFEASLSLLSSETELELGRIIVFLNSRLLVQADSSITEWIDGAVHFADALCFTHRENDNASEIAKCKERFESMRYPLETYVLGKKKAPPLERILFPSARRISHAFDPQDLLEPEDSPQNDTYLARQPNGKRQRPIPRPFASR